MNTSLLTNAELKGTDESASLWFTSAAFPPGFSADPGSGSRTLRRCKYMPADEFAATGHWYAPSAASGILEHH